MVMKAEFCYSELRHMPYSSSIHSETSNIMTYMHVLQHSAWAEV